MKTYSIYFGIGLWVLVLISSCRYKRPHQKKGRIPMRELQKSIPDTAARDTFLSIPEPIRE